LFDGFVLFRGGYDEECYWWVDFCCYGGVGGGVGVVFWV